MGISRRLVMKAIGVSTVAHANLNALKSKLLPELEGQSGNVTSGGQTKPWSNLTFTNPQEVVGAEGQTLIDELAKRTDVANIVSQKGLSLSSAQFKVVKHSVKNSSVHLLASAWQISSTELLIYYELDSRVDRIQTMARLYQIDPQSHNASLVTRSLNASTHAVNIGTAVTPNSCNCSRCSTCCPDTGCCYDCPTCNMNWGCVAACCASCAFAGSLVWVCVATYCPGCSVASCCSWQTHYCCDTACGQGNPAACCNGNNTPC